MLPTITIHIVGKLKRVDVEMRRERRCRTPTLK